MNTIIYLLNLLDYITTKTLIMRFGIEGEANPFMKWVMQDSMRVILFKFIAPLLVLFALEDMKKDDEHTVKIVKRVWAIFYGLIVIWNTIQLIIY